MDNLLEFLTSKEIIIVYLIAGLSCIICFVVYLVEKNNERLRKRHNTRELNKLVKQVREKTKIEEEPEPVIYKEPVLEVISTDAASVDQMLEVTGKIKPINEEIEVGEPLVIEPKKEDNSIEELEYTTIEPDKETAKIELKKLEEELLMQEQAKQDNNIKLTDYEVEQESSAIISLEELVTKGKEIYEANEQKQYMDEGNEPISLNDLEKKMDRKASEIKENFVIENVVPKEELQEIEKEVKKENVGDVKVESKFHSSPIISPIFGIERINNAEPNDLELENTANYEKLDKELNKSDEFLMTLKELHNKLD